jgi:hypothetical protein
MADLPTQIAALIAPPGDKSKSTTAVIAPLLPDKPPQTAPRKPKKKKPKPKPKRKESKAERKRRIAKSTAERLRRRQQRLAEDPDAVFSFKEWCSVIGVSERQGRVILASGDGPVVTRLSDRRIGITRKHNQEWLQSRAQPR